MVVRCIALADLTWLIEISNISLGHVHSFDHRQTPLMSEVELDEQRINWTDRELAEMLKAK
jgi:hypothetical protein